MDREEVKLAVVYGGFTSSNLFRDIDVAIFTGFSVPLEKEIEYCEELSRTLTEKFGIYVDVRLLDYAPPWFREEALSKCQVLIDRGGYRITLLRASREEMQDIRAKLRRIRGSV